MRDHGMRAQPGLVRSAPFNGMTVSDHGRVTVIQLFTEIPNHELFGRILWGQEFAHRWGALVHFNDGGVDSGALLGRQQAHWSWYLDSNWSWMEGNDWKDNTDGTFTTNVAAF